MLIIYVGSIVSPWYFSSLNITNELGAETDVWYLFYWPGYIINQQTAYPLDYPDNATKTDDRVNYQHNQVYIFLNKIHSTMWCIGDPSTVNMRKSFTCLPICWVLVLSSWPLLLWWSHSWWTLDTRKRNRTQGKKFFLSHNLDSYVTIRCYLGSKEFSLSYVLLVHWYSIFYHGGYSSIGLLHWRIQLFVIIVSIL